MPSTKRAPAKKKKTLSLDELIYLAMEQSKQVKDCCRALTTQALHSPDVNRFAKCIRSCLEMGEVADLLLFILSNSSPNTKSAIRFTLEAVQTCEKECAVHKGDEYCQMSCQLCAQTFKSYKTTLRSLARAIH